MKKELLVKVWTATLIFLLFLIIVSFYWMPSEFIYGNIGLILSSFLCIFSFLGIFISQKAMKLKIKFSKNLLIISAVCILVFIIFLFVFWIILSCYGCLPQTVGKTTQLVDYSCSRGTARVIIMNLGTETIDTACNHELTGNSETCGELLIVKSAGGDFNNALLNTNSITPRGIATFTENCGINNTCTYRFRRTTEGEWPSPNIATVSC